MGLIKGLIEQERMFHNASKCKTWNDVYTSHLVEGKNIVIKFEHIFGLVILLCIGLGASLVIYIMENLNWNIYLVHKNKVV